MVCSASVRAKVSERGLDPRSLPLRALSDSVQQSVFLQSKIRPNYSLLSWGDPNEGDPYPPGFVSP